MDPIYIKLAIGGLVLLGSIGLFFGIGLALAAHKFAVEVNPKVEAVKEVLAGAQCGGCGFAGCEAYAEAVVNDPDVPPNLCFPGKSSVAEAVAQITGKQMGAMEDLVAVVHCARSIRKDYKKYDYIGYGRCSGANLAFAGPTDCQYGCVGFGECAGACPFDAITMENHFPVIDEDLCVGCGTCVKTCPKHLITLVPKKARVVVRCSTRNTGKLAHQICEAGCMHCQSCIRDCPAEAVDLVDGIIRIDHHKCLDYGQQCDEACIKACFMAHAIQPHLARPLFQKDDSHEPTAQEALAL